MWKVCIKWKVYNDSWGEVSPVHSSVGAKMRSTVGLISFMNTNCRHIGEEKIEVKHLIFIADSFLLLFCFVFSWRPAPPSLASPHVQLLQQQICALSSKSFPSLADCSPLEYWPDSRFFFSPPSASPMDSFTFMHAAINYRLALAL